MTVNPLHAAAYAGKLAGAFCSAVMDALESFAAEPDPEPIDEFDEEAAARYLEESAPDCGLGHHLDHVAIDEPYSLRIDLQPGDLAAVQLPGGELITGVWDPKVEGSIDTDPERVAAARANNTTHLVGTVESGLISDLPAPADGEARTALRPAAGDAPRVDPIPSAGDAGRTQPVYVTTTRCPYCDGGIELQTYGSVVLISPQK